MYRQLLLILLIVYRQLLLILIIVYRQLLVILLIVYRQLLLILLIVYRQLLLILLIVHRQLLLILIVYQQLLLLLLLILIVYRPTLIGCCRMISCLICPTSRPRYLFQLLCLWMIDVGQRAASSKCSSSSPASVETSRTCTYCQQTPSLIWTDWSSRALRSMGALETWPTCPGTMTGRDWTRMTGQDWMSWSARLASRLSL